MYTTHHPCWDAKNRHELKEELPFSYDEIALCVMGNASTQGHTVVPSTLASKPQKLDESTTNKESIETPHEVAQSQSKNTGEIVFPPPIPEGTPKALADLMRTNEVSEFEIQVVVAQKGYYPNSMPIVDYDPQFISGVLVAAWDKVFTMIQENRQDLPF